jgi:hypothetical protein
MLRKTGMVCIFLAAAIFPATGADLSAKSAKLSPAEIVDKNIAARGGLQAWHAVQTMSMTGKMEAGGNTRPTVPMTGKRIPSAQLPAPRPKEQVQLPFTMELKRPRKLRLEIQFNGQTAVQVYDGANGWKLRPFLNRHEVEPYTTEEIAAASLQSDLDGPLVDYTAKGTKVELEGTEKVESRDCYKLKLTLKSGQVQHVWVDAQTFLETKMEGAPRRLDGKLHPVATYLRDYRSVGHVMVPYLLETSVDGIKQVEKIQIDNVLVNPNVSDARFAKLQ